MVANAIAFTLSVTDTLAIQSQSTATPVAASATTSGFGNAVVLSANISSAAPSPLVASLQSAITTLQQTATEAKDFNKNAAAQRLELALKEIALLRLLQPGLPAAREAVRLAKQIQSAVEDYQAAGGSDGEPASEDPFLTAASAGLNELQQFLKRLLPVLKNAPDARTRGEAAALGDSFDTAEAAITAAISGSVSVVA
jgi:hypothetical protein